MCASEWLASNTLDGHISRWLCARAEDPLVGSIAQQLLTDREAHDKTAAEWTKRYAQG